MSNTDVNNISSLTNKPSPAFGTAVGKDDVSLFLFQSFKQGKIHNIQKHQRDSWIAQWFRYPAADPEVGSLMLHWASLTRPDLDDT